MKISIVNANPCDNLGYATILKTMVDSLGNGFPNANFLVIGDTAQKDLFAFIGKYY